FRANARERKLRDARASLRQLRDRLVALAGACLENVPLPCFTRDDSSNPTRERFQSDASHVWERLTPYGHEPAELRGERNPHLQACGRNELHFQLQLGRGR